MFVILTHYECMNAFHSNATTKLVNKTRAKSQTKSKQLRSIGGLPTRVRFPVQECDGKQHDMRVNSRPRRYTTNEVHASRQKDRGLVDMETVTPCKR